MPKAIHSTRVITPNGVIHATIFIADGKIESVLKGRVEKGNVPFESFGDHVIMPGVIDPHVHINEPGRTEWEGFETATRAAAAGGITTLIEMPLNASPVTTTNAALTLKLEAAKGKLHTNCGFYGGVIPSNINDLDDLLNVGVFGIKAFLIHSGIDEFPNVTEADLRKALPILKKHDAILLVHCEIEDRTGGNFHTRTDPRTYAAYLATRPAKWETDAIQLMIRLSEEFDVHVHIVHVSSAEALPLIRDAKERGLKITAETCPHYLVFCAEEIPDGATQYKCAPPIRDRANNELLWAALKDGTLDFVASDHSPAPPDIKETESGNFMKAWGGIAGMQFGLSAFWTGAKVRGFSLDHVALLLCERPAKFLELSGKGRIEVGFEADLVIWDPEASFVVEEADVLHRHKLSPYVGQTLFGNVHSVLLRGENTKTTERKIVPLLKNFDKLEYLPSKGFRIAGHDFTWGMSREIAREQLGMTHRAQDHHIDMGSSMGEAFALDIKQDRYTNLGGKKNELLLGYDKDDHLSDIEVSEGLDIHIGTEKIAFGQPFEPVLDRLTIAGFAHIIDDDGALFKREKFTLSDAETMGGKGHGVAYFYAADDISHLLE